MIDKVLLEYIQTHAGKNTAQISDDIMQQYLASCKAALTEMFTAYNSKFPTVSDLGRDTLTMWCRRNYPDVREEIRPTLHLTFWQGKVVEALIIALLRQAGVEIISEQERVYLHDEHVPDPIRGRMDIVVKVGDQVGIVDIKIAHGESFTNKWKSHETLTMEDSYGYNSQAAAYELGANLPFIGWLVFNKDTSDLKFVKNKNDGTTHSALNAALSRVEKAYGERPELPMEAEYYLGQPTGNTRVPPYYARSPYARLLWPDATYAKRGKQTIIYTNFVENKIPGVKLENEPKKEKKAKTKK